MKLSIINQFVKNLATLLNDERFTFVITNNYLDKCNIVVYWCDKQVLHDFIIFNDSTLNDGFITEYKIIMDKHPVRQGKQLFSLRYDSVGYCSLAITDSSNLELYGTSHKRISKQLAKTLYEYATGMGENDFISCYTDKYTTSYNYSQNLMFKL